MHPPLNSPAQTAAESVALSAPQLLERVGKLEGEVVSLRRQVAWFQRQIFCQKLSDVILSQKVTRAFWARTTLNKNTSN